MSSRRRRAAPETRDPVNTDHRFHTGCVYSIPALAPLDRDDGWRHSVLIPASRIIRWYFADSSSMNVANAPGVEPIASKPSRLSRSFTSGCASAFTTSAWSFAVISAGRPFGPHRPYHETNSKPVIPDSAMVGMSGAAATSLLLVTASALILPASARGSDEAIGSAIR